MSSIDEDLNSLEGSNWLDEIKWDEKGLVPAIAQDEATGKVVMFAWMNRESLAMSLDMGRAVYWSRSRKKIWAKGEESGHVQKIKSIRVDCDKDVLLLSIEQVGGIACHTGRESCFYFSLEQRGVTNQPDSKLSSDLDSNLEKLANNPIITEAYWKAVEPVIKNPDEIYK